MLNKKGLILVSSIILILFVSIAVVGVTVFIIQRLSNTQTLRLRERTLNSAHAGLGQAFYFFRFNDIAANGFFHSRHN